MPRRSAGSTPADMAVRPAVLAALLGAADTGAFLASRPQLFREKPARAASSVALTALWLGTAAGARRDHPGAAATGAALGLLGVNGVLLAAHLRAGIATPRIFAGAALATVAAGDVLRRR